ncbi:MAG: flagellar M-ring protein FliF [Lachnospiraceae bacterium]|nr:flagellar M-ring protein FliF [Lachnospiraceae bacterium]MDE6185333.1 flagellar M-ring protein FliF [Lachnospiraceae bacterium]
MAERVKELLSKILEWWNKFSTRQKTFIISAGAGIILAFAILISILMRPQYILLLNCETTKEASEVSELLSGADLDYQVSDDGYQIKINKDQQSEANLLLGANNIQSYAYTIDNVTDGGFTTTEADKQRKYELYLETRLANDIIGKFASVKTAVVDLVIPERTGTLIDSEEESSIWIVLELNGEFSTEAAANLAKGVSVAIGNTTTEKVVITDTNGNMLFSGDDSYSAAGTASSQMGVKAQWETKIKNDVRQVLLGTNTFDKVEVAVNLNMDFSSANETDHRYYVEGDNTQGYLSSERIFSSSATNGNSDIPGTDSNGQQQEYVYQDNAESNSETSEEERKYLPSETITNRDIPPGTINYDLSTISLATTNMNVIREEDVSAQGLLDGISWEEYKLANAGQTQVEVPEDLYNVVSKATGFPVENIAIVAYSENVFFDKEGLNVSGSDVVQIVLIVVILALLAFVVIRSMRSEKEAEQPEELSVESLLQSQPEVELEDIGTEPMSETRRLIEKFVDENPEAVASLLRNWLNEGWG